MDTAWRKHGEDIAEEDYDKMTFSVISCFIFSINKCYIDHKTFDDYPLLYKRSLKGMVRQDADFKVIPRL